MEYIAKFKRKKRIYMIYVGIQWTDKPTVINGKYFENVDFWLSERIDVLVNEKNIVATDIEIIYKELDDFFLLVKSQLFGITFK